MEALVSWIVRLPGRPITESLPPSALLYLVPPLPSTRALVVGLVLVILGVIRLFAVLPPRPIDPLLVDSHAKHRTDEPATRKRVKVALFLGSGGHTTELLQLLHALPSQRYTERLYLYSSGDRFSLQKARDFERHLAQLSPSERNGAEHTHASGHSTPSSTSAEPQRVQPSSMLEIPRARRVHQSFLSTPLSLAYSLAFCIEHLVRRPLWHVHVTQPSEWLRKKRTDGWEGEARCAFADLVLMNGPGTCVPIVAAVYVLKFFGFPAPKLMYIESFARVKSLSLTARLLRPLVDRFVVQWPEAGGAIDGRTVYNKWLV